MQRAMRTLMAVGLTAATAGCPAIPLYLFPKFAPDLFEEPPAPLGPYAWTERRVVVDEGADGQPLGITIFEPVGAEGPRPALVWVLGVNNLAHYHQSFHEHMASHGYIDVIPDTRDIYFADRQYNARNVNNALLAFGLTLDGALDLDVDPQRVALGGYSAGATMAAFAAAQEPRAQALTMWAPTSSPVWQGVDPQALLPQVTQPSLFMMAALDESGGPQAYPREMIALMTQADVTQYVIPGGVHLYFQQPSGADDRNPTTNVTREAQMSVAIEETRAYLDAVLGAE